MSVTIKVEDIGSPVHDLDISELSFDDCYGNPVVSDENHQTGNFKETLPTLRIRSDLFSNDRESDHFSFLKELLTTGEQKPVDAGLNNELALTEASPEKGKHLLYNVRPVNICKENLNSSTDIDNNSDDIDVVFPWSFAVNQNERQSEYYKKGANVSSPILSLNASKNLPTKENFVYTGVGTNTFAVRQNNLTNNNQSTKTDTVLVCPNNNNNNNTTCSTSGAFNQNLHKDNNKTDRKVTTTISTSNPTTKEIIKENCRTDLSSTCSINDRKSNFAPETITVATKNVITDKVTQFQENLDTTLLQQELVNIALNSCEDEEFLNSLTASQQELQDLITDTLQKIKFLNSITSTTDKQRSLGRKKGMEKESVLIHSSKTRITNNRTEEKEIKKNEETILPAVKNNKIKSKRKNSNLQNQSAAKILLAPNSQTGFVDSGNEIKKTFKTNFNQSDSIYKIKKCNKTSAGSISKSCGEFPTTIEKQTDTINKKSVCEDKINHNGVYVKEKIEEKVKKPFKYLLSTNKLFRKMYEEKMNYRKQISETTPKKKFINRGTKQTKNQHDPYLKKTNTHYRSDECGIKKFESEQLKFSNKRRNSMDDLEESNYSENRSPKKCKFLGYATECPADYTLEEIEMPNCIEETMRSYFHERTGTMDVE